MTRQERSDHQKRVWASRSPEARAEIIVRATSGWRAVVADPRRLRDREAKRIAACRTEEHRAKVRANIKKQQAIETTMAKKLRYFGISYSDGTFVIEELKPTNLCSSLQTKAKFKAVRRLCDECGYSFRLITAEHALDHKIMGVR